LLLLTLLLLLLDLTSIFACALNDCDSEICRGPSLLTSLAQIRQFWPVSLFRC